MKKVIKILFVLLLLFAIAKSVQANSSIHTISMDIYIDENGNANIHETWLCTIDSGTEGYRPYYNLGTSQIENFSVSRNSRKYQTLSSWNTKASFEEKAYKCGINRIKNGLELCWGISEYAGSGLYDLSYTITNFVSELTDSQMVYWTLIPYEFEQTIERASIKIYSDYYMPKTTDVWGFGNKGGTCYVYDGYIEMESNGSLAKNEYMTILAKFPLGTFNTKNKLNNDFQHYLDMAKEGSSEYSEKFDIGIILTIILNMIEIGIPFIIILITLMLKKVSKVKISKEQRNKLRKVEYFRDIPCDGNLYMAYYVSQTYNISKNKTDLLGAIILKWLKEGNIRIEEQEDINILKKKKTSLNLKEAKIENLLEKEIYDMLYEASKDGILENKELEKWCKKHYSKILRWFDDLMKKQRDELIEKELLIEEKSGFFSGKRYISTDELIEQAVQLKGLKKYLNNYTLISNREAIEVTLFEQYLIYAQMMGIAKKVAKQFKDLYPEIIEQSNYYSYDNIIFINYCATRGITSATQAQTRARNYSGGGGGFSSGGGGGGSFGGGGGGRRI